MKDSSGDFANTRDDARGFAKDGFDVFVGSERFLLENLRGGGVGCITATGNVNAAAIERLFVAWRSPEADRLQEELNGVRGVVEKLPVIPALKAIVADHSGDPAWLRSGRRWSAAPDRRGPLVADLHARRVRDARAAGVGVGVRRAPSP